ncbi:hypothetical protein N9C56_14420, partial [Paracoccaceae bacterium]|nr:hypothetical protein [Paracoccaceae bacterium]
MKVMWQTEAFGDIFPGCLKIVFDTLPDWLESLPPILAPGRCECLRIPRNSDLKDLCVMSWFSDFRSSGGI